MPNLLRSTWSNHQDLLHREVWISIVDLFMDLSNHQGYGSVILHCCPPFGMLRSEADHSILYKRFHNDKHILLVIYVDDIVITGADYEGIIHVKQQVGSEPMSKAYFLYEMKIQQFNYGIN